MERDTEKRPWEGKGRHGTSDIATTNHHMKLSSPTGEGVQPHSERTDCCCSQPLSLWSFVTAVTRHLYSEGFCCPCRIGPCTWPITVPCTGGLRMCVDEQNPCKLLGKKAKQVTLQEAEDSQRFGGP